MISNGPIVMLSGRSEALTDINWMLGARQIRRVTES
jgi:hypothetical protein